MKFNTRDLGMGIDQLSKIIKCYIIMYLRKYPAMKYELLSGVYYVFPAAHKGHQREYDHYRY